MRNLLFVQELRLHGSLKTKTSLADSLFLLDGIGPKMAPKFASHSEERSFFWKHEYETKDVSQVLSFKFRVHLCRDYDQERMNGYRVDTLQRPSADNVSTCDAGAFSGIMKVIANPPGLSTNKSMPIE